MKLDCGSEGYFRLKYFAGASLLQSWEPLHATVGDHGRVEIVVVMLGGGIRTKKQNQKAERVRTLATVLEARKSQVKMSAVQEFAFIKGCEKELGDFLTSIEKSPLHTINALIEKMSLETVGHALTTLKEAGGSVENKLSKVACQFLGAECTKMSEIHSNLETMKDVVCTAFVYGISKHMSDDNSFDLGSLRGLLEKAEQRKIGARAADAPMTG
eukprot:Skav204209  [mRNA]  locus=scaffold985:399416:400057:- [translate_table: standard]